MNYNNQNVTDYKANLADDDLNRIDTIKASFDLAVWQIQCTLTGGGFSFTQSDVNSFKGALNDAFADLFHADYQRLLEESGSLTAPTKVPEITGKS